MLIRQAFSRLNTSEAHLNRSPIAVLPEVCTLLLQEQFLQEQFLQERSPTGRSPTGRSPTGRSLLQERGCSRKKRWPSNEVTLDFSCNCSFKVVGLSVTVWVNEKVDKLLSVCPYCNSTGLLRG